MNQRSQRSSRFFECYRTQNRSVAEELAGAELTFTSPQDDHLDRATYFEKCFPTAGRVRSQQLLRVVAATDEDVFVMYEYELLNGARYRNAELLTVRDGQIVEVQVFFGGQVTASGQLSLGNALRIQ